MYKKTSFYHALTSPDKVKDLYDDEVLMKMAKELTNELKENESIDWQHKQSGRARMRSIEDY
ncbi:MAG TPA: type I restriction enzyme endonuclease domain-containing protein [Tissierellaceae bacterium]|nr:type I restriction enzyme endonuclease domain-containing protein [Tissierellaceae bacterium]